MYLLLKKDGNFPAQSSGVFGRPLVVFQYVPFSGMIDRSVNVTPLWDFGEWKKTPSIEDPTRMSQEVRINVSKWVITPIYSIYQ